MADNKEKARFGIAGLFNPVLLSLFLPCNQQMSENNQKSKSDHGVSSGLELSSIPNKLENGSIAHDHLEVEVVQKPFPYLEEEVEKSDSAPIPSLQSPFNNYSHCIDIKGSNIQEKRTEGKRREVKLDDESSSSYQRGREAKLATTHTLPKTRSEIVRPSDEDKDEGAIETLRNNKLVLVMMGLSVTIFFSLMTFHDPSNMNLGMRIFMQLLPISSAAFFSGIVLRKKGPRFSDKIKLVGYACLFLGIFGVMASYLWFYAALIPILCAIIAFVLIVMICFNKL